MKRKLTGLSRQYHAALRKHLEQGARASSPAAQGLGRQAVTMGLGTLDLARIHEQALISRVSPVHSRDRRGSIVRRAGAFFAEVITPLEQTHRTARETNLHLGQINDALRQRTVELLLSNRQLQAQIAQRKQAEEALKKSEQHYGRLLEQSRQMQEQLRLLSRQLLSAQEEERKRISRELHDVIAQTLTSINLRLTSLKQQAALSTKGLERSIARTQLLVERSVNIVHRFARELRPTVLDDLGLIPALHAFMKNFRKQTGVRVSLSAYAAVEQLNGDKRTVLFRVVQEALANIARHAHASQADVDIQKLDSAVHMTIQDDGIGFQTDRVLQAKKGKRLGLLGMRERLEMVGGSFTTTSAPRKGTTILAIVPLVDRPRGGGVKKHN